MGLEDRYRARLGGMHPRVIVEIGVDYGYSAFTLARDFPAATVYAVDPYSAHTLHDDAEEWFRSHLGRFPNLRHVRLDSQRASEMFVEGRSTWFTSTATVPRSAGTSALGFRNYGRAAS